jgi:hypothetical protein
MILRSLAHYIGCVTKLTPMGLPDTLPKTMGKGLVIP